MVASGTCTTTRTNGSPCRAPAMQGNSHCFFHSPETVKERAAARAAGGHARSAAVLPPGTEPVQLEHAQDVAGLLSRTIGHVLTGELDPKVANTVGYLSSVLLRALEVGALEERLAVLEQAVRSRPATSLFEHDPVDFLLVDSGT